MTTEILRPRLRALVKANRFRRIGDLRFGKVATFTAIGDSLTNRSTFLQFPTGQNGIGYDIRSYAAMLEILTGRRLLQKGPTPANTYKTGANFDRDHGYVGVSAYDYRNGNPTYWGTQIPLVDAIASDPDFFIVHIGTNEIGSVAAATIASRIQAIWTDLRATGKPVIGTDIIQRASYHNSAVMRDAIISVNQELRSSWRAYGLASYRQWDDLIEKDGNGYALASYYPDNSEGDGIHHGTELARLFALDLLSYVGPFVDGVAPPVPADGAGSWITPNPYVTGGTTLAPSWATSFLGVVGTDVIYSKLADDYGTWQRATVVNNQIDAVSPNVRGIYARLTSSAQVGKVCVATARVRIPTGQNFSGVGLSVQCVGAANPWTYPIRNFWQTALCPIGEFEATLYSDPFTIPAGTTIIDCLINPGRGTGILDFQKAGIFQVA